MGNIYLSQTAVEVEEKAIEPTQLDIKLQQGSKAINKIHTENTSNNELKANEPSNNEPKLEMKAPIIIKKINKNRNIDYNLLIHGYFREISCFIPTDILKSILIFIPKYLKMYGIGLNKYGEFGINNFNSQHHWIELEAMSKLLYFNCNLLNTFYHRFGVLWIMHHERKKINFCGNINQYFGDYFGINIKKISTFCPQPLYSELLDDNEYIELCSNGVSQTFLYILTNKNKLYASGGSDYQYIMKDTRFKWMTNPTELTEINNFFFGINNIKLTKIECDRRNTYFLTNKGLVYYIGRELDQMVQKSWPINYLIPQFVPGLNKKNINNIIVDVVTGYNSFALFLNDKGRVYGIGNWCCLGLDHPDIRGKIFGGFTVTEAILNPNLMGIIDIKCGCDYAFCLSKTGKLYGFGDNNSGQIPLGKGFLTCPERTYLINAFDNLFIKSVFCGYRHAMVFTKNNDLYAFGCNEHKECNLNIDDKKLFHPLLISPKDIGILNVSNKNEKIVNIILGEHTTIFIVDV